MILTGSEIHDQVLWGTITIDPFDPSHLNPNSYNYHLAPTLRLLESSADEPQTATLSQDRGYLLEPKRLYLASTAETIGSATYVPSLIGRSSLGRLGLFLQLSADLGQLGSISPWTLELTVVQPLRIYPGMAVGQVTFWRPYGERRRLYRGEYQGQQGPTPCYDPALGTIQRMPCEDKKEA